ncbi:class I SAM-dependent methyltransferase [Emcibacter sp. SYSU 3D8]|uniref:class I SAM-dependent methyltransferase n=1 Tax=Emcibacter sp. SYSU 3D8 TaxID=3133969 RepID=UPI0031FECC8A
MTVQQSISGYRYANAAPKHTHAYLMPTVRRELAAFFATQPTGSADPAMRRIFELGCGNGSMAARLTEAGYHVCGVDPSTEGIAQARSAYPELRLEAGSAYDDLVARFGRFPAVVSLEVVEHVYAPRDYARTLYDLVEPGGMALVSTPYHGYLKNVALAVSGRLDAHFTALWDNGHIKFWSIPTLTTLLTEAGFRDIRFRRIGRIPPLAKSMIAIARKA